MSLVFFLVDFFTYNEDLRYEHEPTWKFHGGHFFLTMCHEASHRGWKYADQAVRDARNGRHRATNGSGPDGLFSKDDFEETVQS